MPKTRNRIRPPVSAPRARILADVERRLEAIGRVYDKELLAEIYRFSEEMHTGQLRRSGEPYFLHPVNVAYLLADLKFDYVSVAVGLLHDVLEDTLTTREVLAGRFGEEIAELVDGVTKIGRHEYVRRDEAQAETFRKMILASAKDVRVVLVKLADRLHNMMTLEPMPPEARRRISRETLEIYAPLAHRLGMSRVKGDLEDLAFYYLYPLQFAELHTKIEREMRVGQDTIRRIRERLVEALEAAGIEAEITFRVKRYYSIYQKLRRQGIDISQLYDYLAFRVITEHERDTYAALGVVHHTWRPIMGRFKDYIAVPKPNGYQSLHTTVVGEKGKYFELQIRTREMDLVAEEGIAAHWQYKEDASQRWQGDPNILWLRQLLEWQQDVQDPRTFLTTLKIDLYPDEVYVFSPKGDVFSFPRGATPLDFAYKVHTEVGHHCSGARINGRLVPLRTELANGDLIEILTNPARQPSRDWLAIVATSRAKSKIRQWLNTEQKKRATEIGRRLFEKEVRRYKTGLRKVLDSSELSQVLEAEGIASAEDLMSRIGFGKTSAKSVLERVLPAEQLVGEGDESRGAKLRHAVSKILPFKGSGPIVVKGQDDLLAYLAKCCNPLPGEEIVGYVTRGRGVSVHSVDCPNVQNLLYHPEREIEVEWGRAKDRAENYLIALVVETQDRPGILARLADAIASQESNIAQIEAATAPGRGMIEVTVQVRDRKHLERILSRVRGVSGVLRVDRRMVGAHAGVDAGA
ncbi:MAG TPA: bifunctional (p)ppGpp synthetase/guanosine-3',5'-bis(diphosphate) 3'-pyrophosphohydrolase [Thermoanaerobaculia bacterium]|nr:bifunctional (p)ppGpp synthetase/guanosine-3',5'-bis(diphosphate) 3'-pyrophosphohydrolase [Thermoanaerobaculia bacterium]